MLFLATQEHWVVSLWHAVNSFVSWADFYHRGLKLSVKLTNYWRALLLRIFFLALPPELELPFKAPVASFQVLVSQILVLYSNREQICQVQRDDITLCALFPQTDSISQTQALVYYRLGRRLPFLFSDVFGRAESLKLQVQPSVHYHQCTPLDSYKWDWVAYHKTIP